MVTNRAGVQAFTVVSRFVRKVRTTSGAVAVQIVTRRGGRWSRWSIWARPTRTPNWRCCCRRPVAGYRLGKTSWAWEICQPFRHALTMLRRGQASVICPPGRPCCTASLPGGQRTARCGQGWWPGGGDLVAGFVAGTHRRLCTGGVRGPGR